MSSCDGGTTTIGSIAVVGGSTESVGGSMSSNTMGGSTMGSVSVLVCVLVSVLESVLLSSVKTTGSMEPEFGSTAPESVCPASLVGSPTTTTASSSLLKSNTDPSALPPPPPESVKLS